MPTLNSPGKQLEKKQKKKKKKKKTKPKQRSGHWEKLSFCFHQRKLAVQPD